jgi:hypothetical protein
MKAVWPIPAAEMPARAAHGWGRLVMALASALLMILIPGAAVASGAGDADVAIKRGVDLRRKGDDVQALEEFKKAYDLGKSPRALGQMGFAEQALGRWRDAEEHLTQALADAEDGWIKKNRSTLERSRAAVAAHLGSLEVLGGPEGAEIRFEGRVIGTLPMAHPLRVAAGTIGVEVRQNGYLPSTRSVTIVVGELTRETVVLQRASPINGSSNDSSNGSSNGSSPQGQGQAQAQASNPSRDLAPQPMGESSSSGGAEPGKPLPGLTGSPDHEPGSWRRPAAWVTGGFAVLFAGGFVAGLLGRSHYTDILNQHVRDATCTQDGDQFMGSSASSCAAAATHRDEARTLGLVSGGVAGALIITSTILFITSPSPRDQRVACAPQVTGPFGAGLVGSLGCSMRW